MLVETFIPSKVVCAWKQALQKTPQLGASVILGGFIYKEDVIQCTLSEAVLAARMV